MGADVNMVEIEVEMKMEDEKEKEEKEETDGEVRASYVKNVGDGRQRKEMCVSSEASDGERQLQTEARRHPGSRETDGRASEGREQCHEGRTGNSATREGPGTMPRGKDREQCHEEGTGNSATRERVSVRL